MTIHAHFVSAGNFNPIKKARLT